MELISKSLSEKIIVNYLPRAKQKINFKRMSVRAYPATGSVKITEINYLVQIFPTVAHSPAKYHSG